jgi:hypothetical protein
MKNERTSRDFLIDRDAEASRIEVGYRDAKAATANASAKQYSDAELYRIIVAKALREGRFHSKADFDVAASELGTIEQADEIIAFNRLRPDCDAWRHGQLMVCECGASWKVDEPNPPVCRKVQR